VLEYAGTFFLFGALITMKKYADRKRAEVDEYKVGDLVILSTKDLKYQMIERRTEKLTERFVGPYKINVTVALWTSSHILYGLPLHQKNNISKATC